MRATIFFLTFVIFAAALVLRVDQVMFSDKLASSETQSRAQMSSLSPALATEIRGLKDTLSLSSNEIEQSPGGEYSAARPYSRFQMVAKLQPPNPKEGKTEWQIQSSFFLEKSAVKSWASPYITLALKTVQASDVRPGAAQFYSLMDPQRKPFLLMLTNASGTWYAGILGPETFQALMDRQKGQKSTVFVVNTQGQALAHTTQEYIGSLLTEDPLVAELMKSSTGSGFGSFVDLKGESVQGLYEQVENSNLYAVITTPVKVLVAGRDSTRMQLGLLGAGLALIGLAIFFFSDRGAPAAAPAQKLPPVMAPGIPAAGSVSTAHLTGGGDKMKAYVQVASSLSHELKAPLTSILGNAQLATSQIQEEAPKEYLRKIEKEARIARDIIQKLLTFAGEDKVSSQKVSLDTAVNKALKNVEGRILAKGIKLQKNFQTVPAFNMPVDLVVRAIENVLLNAIEAMERAPKKELKVTLVGEDKNVLLTIEDTGEGIDSENLPKVLDPFFTTRSGTQHVGLGLSTAMGIFKEVSGEIQITSELGRGTKVHVRFETEKISTSSGIILGPSLKPASHVQTPLVASDEGGFKIKEAQPAPLDPLLVDNTIERLIEGDVPDMPPPPEDAFKVDMTAEVLKAPRAPKSDGSEEPPKQDEAPGFDSFSLELEPAESPYAPLPDAIQPDESAVVKPAPAAKTSAAPQAQAAAPAGNFSAKIDKPKIDLKKKASRVDNEAPVTVRKPGARS